MKSTHKTCNSSRKHGPVNPDSVTMVRLDNLQRGVICQASEEGERDINILKALCHPCEQVIVLVHIFTCWSQSKSQNRSNPPFALRVTLVLSFSGHRVVERAAYINQNIGNENGIAFWKHFFSFSKNWPFSKFCSTSCLGALHHFRVLNALLPQATTIHLAHSEPLTCLVIS